MAKSLKKEDIQHEIDNLLDTVMERLYRFICGLKKAPKKSEPKLLEFLRAGELSEYHSQFIFVEFQHEASE